METLREISCIIDGRPVSVKPGTPIIEAAAKVGIIIPRFCYHKLLKPYGGCRMCLVDITKSSSDNPHPNPRPQPSCLVPVEDGMEIDTKSEKVKAIRKAMMEFTLINHPLDCPVCDKGGECDLQDLAFVYGREDSRFSERKMSLPHHQLSSLIILDYNRCILCKRCVRWTEEIADDDRLVYASRGSKTRVATFNNTQFMSRFGGMAIELCPVGALTSEVFRFKSRVWEVATAISTCAECANGCSLKGHTRNDRIMRLLSKEDPTVNGPYLCDKGRFAHDYIDNPDRIIHPVAAKDGQWQKISWEDAAAIFAESFKKSIQADGPKAVAACADPSDTIEGLWAFRRLFRDILGTPGIEHAPAPLGLDPEDASAILSRLARFETVLKSHNLVLWDSDPFCESPVLGLRMKLAWTGGDLDGISINSAGSFLGRHGFSEKIVPPHRSRAILAAIIVALADILRSTPADAANGVEAARKAVSGCSADERGIAEAAAMHLLKHDAVLIIGSRTLLSKAQEMSALVLIASLREAAAGETLSILPIFRCANSIAALALGLRTQLLQGPTGPGGVGFTGQSTLEWPREIEKGKIKTVFASGDGLLHLLGHHDIAGFDKLEFLAVASDFMNPLAARADLILPALSPFENSGTMVCLDGSVRRLERLVPHPTGAWSSEHFFAQVASVLGGLIPIERTALRADLAASHPAFKSLSEGSTGYLDFQSHIPFRTGDMRHAFDTSEPPGRARFGVIVTETVFPQNSRGIHSPHVAGMPDNFLCGMNPDDAARLGLSEGESVRLVGEPGELRAKLKLLNLPPGYVSIPFGHINHPAAELGIIGNPDIRITITTAGEEPDRRR